MFYVISISSIQFLRGFTVLGYIVELYQQKTNYIKQQNKII